jgi:hypothetical protein
MDRIIDGIAVCMPVICVFLLLGWVGLGYYLWRRLSRHTGLGRTSLQDQAHQVRRVARDLAEKVQTWPACLRPEAAASEYAELMAEEWRKVGVRMARLPGSLARHQTEERAAAAAAGHAGGTPAETVQRSAV